MGIEVTHPVDEKYEELESYYYNNLCGKTQEQISSIGLKKFNSFSCNILFNKQNVVSAYEKPYVPFDIKIIYRAIDKKMKKLNSNLYNYAENIYLFLAMSKFSLEIANYDMAKKILSYTKEANKHYKISYKEIFYDCLFKLYRINLLTDEITEIDNSKLILSKEV